MGVLKAISFDAAGTLVDVQYDPVRFALEGATALNLELDPQVASEVYGRLLLGGRKQYEIINRDGSLSECRQFWVDLTESWLDQLGADIRLAENLVRVVESRMFAENQEVFQLYDDVLPVLDYCDQKGIRLAMISNWDYTLEPALRAAGIFERFEVVVASLIFGVEKPDPLIFDHTLELLGLDAGQVWHIGDDPVADILGAAGVGIRGIKIDRSLLESEGDVLCDLRDLPELVGL